MSERDVFSEKSYIFVEICTVSHIKIFVIMC